MDSNIELFFKEQLKPEATLILAISGGPDSMYLLDQCVQSCSPLGLKLVVAHVNHSLRGRESQKDALFVERVARRHQLRFELITIDLKKIPGNIEENGRKKRYEFFEQLRKKYRGDWILTAHHADDNLETVLFNFIRGASYQGLKGMVKIDPKRRLMRPLLDLTKKEILSSLKKNRLPYRNDRSNNDLQYSRNLLRKKIIPLCEKINPGFRKTFQENQENFNAIAAHIEAKTQRWLKKNFHKNAFPLKKFLELPPFYQKNVLVELYRSRYGNTIRLSRQQLQAMQSVLHQQKANRQKEFGKKYYLRVFREKESNLQKVGVEAKVEASA